MTESAWIAHGVTNEEFEKYEKEGKFAWTVDITGKRYGTTKEAVEQALHDPHMSISPIAPS